MSQRTLLIEDDRLSSENQLDEINQGFDESSNNEDQSYTNKTTSNETRVDELSSSKEQNSSDEIPPKIDRLTDVILDLKWKTRDMIILILNQFSALLKGKIVSNQYKERLVEENNELILILINLGLCLSDRPDGGRKCDENEISSDQNGGDDQRFKKDEKKKIRLCESATANELVLELGQEARIQIIDQLITNQNVAITLNDSVVTEIKNNLVEENKKLIKSLLDLPVDHMYCDRKDNEIDEAIVVEGKPFGSKF